MARFVIYIITPLSGFVMMSLEVLGFRVMAAGFGSAFYISPVVIGVVLIAMSIGYYLGGWSADRMPRLWLLSIFLFIAGFATILIPVYKTGLNDWIFNTEALSTRMAGIFGEVGQTQQWMWSDVFLSAFVMFFIPSMMLACVLPFVIKLATTDVAHAGRTSGALIGLSSVGSILGVFLTSLVFINHWPITRNLYQLGIGLLVLAVIGFIGDGFFKNKSTEKC